MYRCLSCMREFDIENIAKGESKICPFCGYDNDAKPIYAKTTPARTT